MYRFSLKSKNRLKLEEASGLVLFLTNIGYKPAGVRLNGIMSEIRRMWRCVSYKSP